MWRKAFGRSAKMAIPWLAILVKPCIALEGAGWQRG
jgi:hypothetical protein